MWSISWSDCAVRNNRRLFNFPRQTFPETWWPLGLYSPELQTSRPNINDTMRCCPLRRITESRCRLSTDSFNSSLSYISCRSLLQLYMTSWPKSQDSQMTSSNVLMTVPFLRVPSHIAIVSIPRGVRHRRWRVPFYFLSSGKTYFLIIVRSLFTGAPKMSLNIGHQWTKLCESVSSTDNDRWEKNYKFSR